MALEIKTPRWALPLLQPARYKGAKGGRGSGKSHFFAELAVEEMVIDKNLSVVCIREVQKSLKFSAKRLIEDKIEALGVGHLFEVTQTEIRRHGGSGIMIFQGMQDHTADSIKSLEGFGRAWVEEAQNLSRRSLELLRPTIRKEGSEIWFSWNPEFPDDPVDEFMVSAPPGSVLVHVNAEDNPFLPQTLREEMEMDRARSPETFDHVWRGGYRTLVEGAIYAKELRAAREGKRIAEIQVEPSLPVDTFWDLGVGDATAIWFAQMVGTEIRLVDYYEASGEGLPHYAQILQQKGYRYGSHFAPHDIQVRELGSGRSRIETAAQLGIRFSVVPRLGLEDGIHAARMVLSRCHFDAVRCRAGITALSSYRREMNKSLGEFKATPVHDWSSHGADAFRYLSVSLQERKEPATPKRYRGHLSAGAGGWMN